MILVGRILQNFHPRETTLIIYQSERRIAKVFMLRGGGKFYFILLKLPNSIFQFKTEHFPLCDYSIWNSIWVKIKNSNWMGFFCLSLFFLDCFHCFTVINKYGKRSIKRNKFSPYQNLMSDRERAKKPEGCENFKIPLA